MKLLLTAGAIALMTIGTASANEFVAADNSIATKICVAVTKDQKLTIASTLRDHRMPRNHITRKLHCNDMPVGKFAQVYGFNKSAEFFGVEPKTETRIRDIAKSDQPVVIYGSK
ncbi:DUF3718 domain-containing protein [Pseudoalteromonas sp. T1lg65]|uniref:DUF3718 domain-containing protein n=1 Tax=Pseudoalteromonas sp. T1lg65 TaxID=2077101 RepID=UPI003F7B29DC